MNIYIDESGSITKEHSTKHPYFIIAMVRVNDNKKLKRVYRRFVSSRHEILQNMDVNNKMFKNGKFSELKGSQFNREFKKEFVRYFARNNLFELYIIKIENMRLTKTFCENTARVFNYVIKLALKYFFENKFLPDEPCNLQSDERNEKTETKYFLRNYLNTELMLGGVVSNEFSVEYFDSSNNCFIQIADVFANLYYSHCKTGAYAEEIKYLKDKGYLKFIFKFPISEY